MFQLDLLSLPRYQVDDFAKNRRLWAISAFSQELGDSRSRQTQVQVFVLVRDFGENWGPETEDGGNDRPQGSCRLPAQNLTEIPPRTERPVGQTSSTVSPLLALDWKSSRLRASITA